MSHITDLLDHADRDPLTSPNAFRYNAALPDASTPKVWRCLYCGLPAPRPFRGCCSARCASLEHDAEPADRED